MIPYCNELGPAVIAFPHASYDAGYYPLYIRVKVCPMVPECQSKPYFNEL